MEMNEALAVLARVGTDDAPTLSELQSARDTVAREIHANKNSGDLEALMSLRETYSTFTQAIEEAEAAEAEANQRAEELIGDIPNPDGEPEGNSELGDEGEDPEGNSSGRVLSVQEAVARLGIGGGGTSSTQVREPEGEDLSATRTRVRIGNDEVENATVRSLAEAFRDAGRSLKAGKERVARIETEFSDQRTLSGKIDENTRLVDSFLSPEAVTAAGGCCSLPEPIFENPVNASTARPIRNSLPTIGATRGKVSFFPAVCLPTGGADLWTCEDDAAVDPSDDTTWKQCAEVTCDESQEVDVEAIYSCVTIGNYKARFAPEQWQAYLQALAAQQARVAEVALFDKMRLEASTTHTVDETGSVYATLLAGVSLAAATIRQDQRLTDVELNLWLPDWIRNAIRTDLRTRKVGAAAADQLEATDAMIAAAFANEGINVFYSPDIDPIEEDSPGQVDGPLTPFPATASSVLAPSGFFSFLDGGTLDLGTEIRDHDLNRQNKLAAFAESFEGLLARGCNAKALDIPVSVCDSAPCPA